MRRLLTVIGAGLMLLGTQIGIMSLAEAPAGAASGGTIFWQSVSDVCTGYPCYTMLNVPTWSTAAYGAPATIAVVSKAACNEYWYEANDQPIAISGEWYDLVYVYVDGNCTNGGTWRVAYDVGGS